nr:ESX secretion-associated protein EspG [Kibdelosporangium phytohabitans]
MSASDFQVIWERQRLGTMPAPLRVLPEGFTQDERRAAVERALASLRKHKLVDPYGEVDHHFADLLRLLARPVHAIDARFALDREYRMRVAGTAHRGALGWQDGRIVTLDAIAATGLADRAVSLLPQVGAGYGRLVSVRVHALDKAVENAGADQRQLEIELRRGGVARSDAHHLVTMTSDVRQRGQFRALAGGRGKLRPRPYVIDWWATGTGMYIAQNHAAPDGQVWRTVAPADHTRLAGHLQRLLAGR